MNNKALPLNPPSPPLAGAASSQPGDAARLSRRPLRVLIVDDHKIVRDGLKQVLADSFPQAVFGEACSGQEALDSLGKAQWDVMLLDLTMPGGGGLEVLSQMSTVQPETKTLVLTMHPEDQFAVRVLKAGAFGYLTKESASEEVVNAVNKVLAGGKYVSASLAQNLVAALNTPPPKAPHETLSDREYQVLRLIAVGRSVKEIAFDLSLSVKTVSTYRTRVLAKLKFTTNADVIRYALREKLVE
jgi:DNA-binding NarL/FixJ family response regulator